jgi:Phosphodiester glycosidase
MTKTSSRPLYALMLLLMATASCTKTELSPIATTNSNTGGPTTEAALIIPPDWPRHPTLNNNLPASIAIHYKTTTLNGLPFRAFMAIVDLRNNNLEFKPVLRSTLSTPSTFYNNEPGTKYITVNGGFFSGGSSVSLVLQNGTRLANNIASVVRNGRTYFPTRAAFGFNRNNRAYSASWVYTLTDGRLFNYPVPSPNDANATPQPRPSATFPAGGGVWGVTDALGGGPMLVPGNGQDITDGPELSDVATNSKRARTAYGYTTDGRLLILVVEHNIITNNPSGATLPEMANIMTSFGAQRAVNMDGSGSSCMLVNGQQTILPSDLGGTQRPIPACLFIKAI